MTICTALITPFHEDFSLDKKGFLTLLEHQLNGGVDALVVLGTTAETPTLSREEKTWLLQQVAATSLPYMVGCGTNSTEETLKNIEWAASHGAKQALVVSPYYNLPPPEGLMAHFLTLADRSPCPILLYNHPGRTGITIPPPMILELAAHPNIIGIKEAPLHLIDTLMTVKPLKPHFSIFAGDDQLALTTMSHGGDGLISVASNLIPRQMKQLLTLPVAEALKLQIELWPLFKALGCTTNPIPIKAAMMLKGLPGGPPRLPLIPLDPNNLQMLKRVIG